MLKKLSILILLIFVCATISAQSKNTVKENKVRSVTEYKQDTEKSTKTKDSYTLFDNNGNIVEEIEYDSSGKIKKHSKYQYDSNNNKIKETELTPEGKISKTHEYKYNGSLKIERKTYDASGKLKSKKTYQYEYIK